MGTLFLENRLAEIEIELDFLNPVNSIECNRIELLVSELEEIAAALTEICSEQPQQRKTKSSSSTASVLPFPKAL